MSAYFISRILAVLFASGMCLGLLVAAFGIAWLIATPIVKILQHYFPSLRPRPLPPLYLNFHKPESVFLSEQSTRPPAKASSRELKQSDFYIGDHIDTERFPVAPPQTADRVAQDLQVTKRALLRYLRATHPNQKFSDEELLRSFTSGIRMPRRLRHL